MDSIQDMPEGLQTSLVASLKSASFPQFSALPTELRIQIWQHALSDGREDGFHLDLFQDIRKSTHHCDISNNAFCGNASECPFSMPSGAAAATEGRQVYAMAAGLFAVCPAGAVGGHPEIGPMLSLARSERSLSLASREAREQVLECFPCLLPVVERARGKWAANFAKNTPRYHQFRCNPARELVVVGGVKPFPSHWGIYRLRDSSEYPPALFPCFRAALLSLEQVALRREVLDDAVALSLNHSYAFMASLRQIYLIPYTWKRRDGSSRVPVGDMERLDEEDNMTRVDPTWTSAWALPLRDYAEALKRSLETIANVRGLECNNETLWLPESGDLPRIGFMA